MQAVRTIAQRIRSCPDGRRLLPVAGATKPSLSASERDDVDALDLSALSGIVGYDPAELTLTALAATPVATLSAELSEHGQYLPFDPLLAAAGATLGGVVACGSSGSNALRHGGVRDFVIGVRFIDGTGTEIAAGGRVVKNAAGFDLAKLMVGSLGRLGVMTELSLKVFPQPQATLTLIFELGSTAAAVACVAQLAGGPRELDAVDIHPGGRLLVRLGGDAAALPARARRLQSVCAVNGEIIDGQAESELWSSAAELSWTAADALLVRVPLTARQAIELEAAATACGGELRFALATNVALVLLQADSDRLERFALKLKALGLSGLVLRGASDRPLIGVRSGGDFAARVRQALDPHDRFLN